MAEHVAGHAFGVCPGDCRPCSACSVTRLLDKVGGVAHAEGVTSDVDTSAGSTGDRARAWAYHRDFWPGILAYGLVLTAVLVWGHLDGTSPWRFLWAVLPVLPALWVVRAVLRHLHRVDEYQRLLTLQGLGVGFSIAMVTAITGGFLGFAGLEPGPFPLSSGCWIVYGAGMLGWAISAAVLSRRAARQ